MTHAENLIALGHPTPLIWAGYSSASHYSKSVRPGAAVSFQSRMHPSHGAVPVSALDRMTLPASIEPRHWRWVAKLARRIADWRHKRRMERSLAVLVVLDDATLCDITGNSRRHMIARARKQGLRVTPPMERAGPVLVWPKSR